LQQKTRVFRCNTLDFGDFLVLFSAFILTFTTYVYDVSCCFRRIFMSGSLLLKFTKLVGIALFALPLAVFAQSAPSTSKTLTIVVPYPAGGPLDISRVSWPKVRAAS
jgi:hypothetical protein